MHGIDLSPLANGVIQVGIATAAVILPPLLAALFGWAFKKIGLTNTQQQAILQGVGDDALQRALDFARGKGAIAVDKYVSNIRIADPTLARGAAYVIAHWPDTFGKLGFDVTTMAGQQAIVRMLTTRLSAAVAADGK